MISITAAPHSAAAPAWHQAFLAMLPAIRRYARLAFGGLPPEARQEAVQEVTCQALQAYHRLVELGKADLAYASVLARYSAARVRAGRRFAARQNVNDILSPYARRRKGIHVERLDRHDRDEQAWQQIVVEDRHAGPADVAATRLDFAAWLQTLTPRRRKLAHFLARGETTRAAARKFGLTDGRISQLRRELMQAWDAFTSQAAHRGR